MGFLIGWLRGEGVGFDFPVRKEERGLKYMLLTLLKQSDILRSGMFASAMSFAIM